jgi:thiamine-phosphate pyrophosphorylase
MEVLVITQPEFWDNENSIIEELFKQGLQILHVRKPDFSTDQLEKYIQSIPKRYHKRIVIHSHHELAMEMQLKGIHITENHRKNPFFLRIKLMYYKFLRPDLQISTSYHSLHQLKRKSRDYDYVMFSPVFESISKKNHKPEYSLSKIQEAIETSPYDVIALGGIDTDKISTCQSMGFYGVGLMGDIWNDKDPLKKYKEFMIHLHETA